ncbi:MAG TPA: DNA ligase [Nocardioides sp.]|nr:DNA ligase [Nocardioides sp.]
MPFVPPMLATKGDRVPAGDEWVHEVKWDGIRAIVLVEPGRVRAFTRNGNPVATQQLAGLGDLGHVMTLDAELVRLDERGPGAARDGGHLCIFDLLALDGRDLTALSWEARRAELDALHLGDDHWVVPPTYDDGEMLLEATRAQGLEGIVSKRRSAPYRPGVRSRDWLKFPHRPRESYVVGGWRPEKDTTGNRLGAILVGTPTADGLAFMGRVGSGLAGRAGARLAEQLAGLTRSTSPFVDALPKADALGTTWVEPRVVVDIESLGIGSQGRLRQPSYQGVRIDLTPEDLR